MKKPYPPVYYADYLQLDKLLGAQKPKSELYNQPAHDEMLFIIVHQAYELWFKQILHELNSTLEVFQKDYVDEKDVGIAVSRLTRITEIQKILIDQLRVLETMTPLDFLEFRDFLIPASGFQSFQFRLVENRLGLENAQRMLFGRGAYHERLSEEHQEAVKQSLESPSLFELVAKWLERTPFVRFGDFDFWAHYREAVRKMLDDDRETISNNPVLSEKEKARQFQEFDKTEASFSALFDEDKHNELVKKGLRRLSREALHAALLISLYRDEPMLNQPYRLLNVLVDVDELFTTWRYRHALMVHRMIGSKIGTGGSSGHDYLKKTAESHKVFFDLFNLSTFLIPRSALPKLPESLRKNLGFYYNDMEKTRATES